MNDREQTESWSLVAGHPALDFVNSVGGNISTASLDAIATYELLLLWSRRAGTLGADQAARLRRAAGRRRTEAAKVVADAHRLRDCVYALFEQLRVGAPDVAAAWKNVQPVVAEALGRSRPVVHESRLSWSWADCTELRTPLYPVAVGAVELATSDLVRQLRRCDRCRWLFLDQSKNHSRRWCDMSTCGVAEKVERQAERRTARRRGR